MNEEYVPDEQDYLDQYASDALEIEWEKWPEKFLEPLTEDEREIAGSAFYDAWQLGLAHGRSERESEVRDLKRLLDEALNLADTNLNSAQMALDLWRD